MAGILKNGPYGRVHYADPGYQADGVPRYPLTRARTANAASRWGNAHNRSFYTATQRRLITSRIRAAERQFGIGEGARSAPRRRR